MFDIEVDKRLDEQLKKPQLVELLHNLAKNKDKKTLSKLLSDNTYFRIDDLVRTLEKTDKKMLFNLLNEPENEINLHQPIRRWLKNFVDFSDNKVKVPGTRREIDVVGCSYSTWGGIRGENLVIAVEVKTKPSMGAINSAFSQAKDYMSCSDYSYVAVSPYVFLKRAKILFEKSNSYDNEIGLVVSDKHHVIDLVQQAEKTGYIEKRYEAILSHFKKT